MLRWCGGAPSIWLLAHIPFRDRVCKVSMAIVSVAPVAPSGLKMVLVFSLPFHPFILLYSVQVSLRECGGVGLGGFCYWAGRRVGERELGGSGSQGRQAVLCTEACGPRFTLSFLFGCFSRTSWAVEIPRWAPCIPAVVSGLVAV
jgi:hypothetical protein